MDHIVLNVKDDEKMIAFYSEVLCLGPERHGDIRLFSRSGRQHDRSTVLRGGGRLGQMPAGIVAEAAFVRTGVEAGS